MSFPTKTTKTRNKTASGLSHDGRSRPPSSSHDTPSGGRFNFHQSAKTAQIEHDFQQRVLRDVLTRNRRLFGRYGSRPLYERLWDWWQDFFDWFEKVIIAGGIILVIYLILKGVSR